MMTVPAAQTTNKPSPATRRMVGMILVVLIGLCLLFVVGYVQRLAEKDAVLAEIAALEQQIAQAKVRNAVLGKELAQVNDDAHIAAVARNSLNLVQEGDQLIMLIDPPEATAEVQPELSAMRTPINTQPNWRRWFDLIFSSR